MFVFIALCMFVSARVYLLEILLNRIERFKVGGFVYFKLFEYLMYFSANALNSFGSWYLHVVTTRIITKKQTLKFKEMRNTSAFS